MAKKKTETRPSNPPVAVRFTPDQIDNINQVAAEFQMSKQDVIRLSVAAGLKAMKKIGLAGLQDFVANEIKPVEKTPSNVTAMPNNKPAPRTAGMMASAGTADSANNCEPQGIDLVNGTVPVRVTGMSMEPLFSDDDIITFRLKGWSRSPYMKKGVIYLVEYNGGNLIKRYNTRKPKPGEDASEYLTGTGMVGVLESLNPEFPDIDITGPFDWVGWYDENFKTES